MIKWSTTFTVEHLYTPLLFQYLVFTALCFLNATGFECSAAAYMEKLHRKRNSEAEYAGQRYRESQEGCGWS